MLRRAGDWLPAVPPRLRRRINHWAWRHGYLITRLPERLDDLLSLVDPRRKDFASRPLLRLLAERRPLRGMNPFAFSFVDTLDALQETAGLLLGSRSPQRLADREKARELALAVRRSLESREPFAVEFLAEFVEPREMLRRSLEFIGLALASGRRVEVAELARVVKDGCRLVLRTGGVEPEKLDALLVLAKEVNLAHDPSPRAGAELDEAVAVFRACLANLPRFAHELYPALLKMIAAFYEEEDADPEKRRRVLSFLELTRGRPPHVGGVAAPGGGAEGAGHRRGARAGARAARAGEGRGVRRALRGHPRDARGALPRVRPRPGRAGRVRAAVLRQPGLHPRAARARPGSPTSSASPPPTPWAW